MTDISDLTDDEMLSLMWQQLGPEARERILRAMADEIVHPRAAARSHKKRGRRKESDRAEKIARQWLAYVQGFKRPEMITIHSHGAKFIDQLPGELRHTSGARSGERNLSRPCGNSETWALSGARRGREGISAAFAPLPV